jgi:hypothetical protein
MTNVKYQYKEGPKATVNFERAMKKLFKAPKKPKPPKAAKADKRDVDKD